MGYRFLKGHGTENDFVLLPDPDGDVHGDLSAERVRALCDRRAGIGGDGVLRVVRGDGKTVCEQTPAHARECRFVPSYTQRYRIVLQNTGKGEARYHIVFD